MADKRIGIAGWTYEPWRGTFYPDKLAQKRELAYASRQLNSIEINGTFYSLHRPESFRAWHDATPDGFIFSVKAARYITHIKRLAGGVPPLANFFASGLLALREKLGPILWQLPPSFKYDHDRVSSFLELLPHDTLEAAKLAKHHEERMKGRVLLKADAKRPVRHAMEVRHESFAIPAFIKLLRAHDIALVVADTAGKWPFLEDVTADYVYVRLHGDEELYVSGYDDLSLERWAKKVRAWAGGGEPADANRVGPPAKPLKRGRDVYVYFDNDVKVRSPYDAMSLSAKLGLRSPPGKGPDPATIAEEPRQRWAAV